MCGIAGWIDFRRDLSEEGATVRTMVATLANRGPDDEAVWTDRRAALGHRRLAVIDVEGGSQPMSVETDGRTVAITYSGETTTSASCGGELGAVGHRFRTRSDTEVVLRGYLEWGEAVAERLNGHVRLRRLGLPDREGCC